MYINNHCPNCDHFEAKRENWPMWNGVLSKAYLDNNKHDDKIVIVNPNLLEHAGHRCNFPNGCGGAEPHRRGEFHSTPRHIWSCCNQSTDNEFCLPSTIG